MKGFARAQSRLSQRHGQPRHLSTENVTNVIARMKNREGSLILSLSPCPSLSCARNHVCHGEVGA